MPIPAAMAVSALLEPELRILAGVNPEAARTRSERMRSDPLAFYRGTNALSCHFLANIIPADGPWVWAMGDAHPGNFATLAVGPRDRDGIIPVRFDVADVDDEHPAPWCWDAVRWLAGVAIARPDQRTAGLSALADAHLDEYRRTIADHRSGDPRWTRIDLAGLPEPLLASLSDDGGAEPAQAYLESHVNGNRLRRASKSSAAEEAENAWLIPALKQAFAHEERPDHEVIDMVRRQAGGGVSSRGRRRWLALIREKTKTGSPLRIVELKERRPSVLARWVAASPFQPMGQQAATVPMGRDPFHAIVAAAPDPLLARTRCHCRKPLDLTACDGGDLVRYARLTGQLLAAFHCRGLQHLGVDRNPLAAADRPGAKDLTAWAQELSAWTLEGAEAFGVSITNSKKKNKLAVVPPTPAAPAPLVPKKQTPAKSPRVPGKA